jgi:hypothetical protein
MGPRPVGGSQERDIGPVRIVGADQVLPASREEEYPTRSAQL